VFSLSLIFNVQVNNYLFSPHAEEVKPNISILTIQSYPKVGGQWTVRFKVEGTADLRITAVDETTWDINQNASCDLQFKKIRTNGEEIPIEWNNNQVIIENFSSSTAVFETSQVLSLGKHILEFTFGEMTVYAYNDASNWWDKTWGCRKKIIINHDQVAGNLNNFPVLVNITDPDLLNDVQSDGGDIVFVSYGDNTSQYAHEIEFFNNSDGSLIAWVNITNLSSTENTSFWMYYGNDDCINQENPSDVWDSNYGGVYHLNEVIGGGNSIRDSTLNNNHGTDSGDPNIGFDGVINNSIEFYGEDEYINCSDSASLRPSVGITIEFWVKVDTFTDWAGIVTNAWDTVNIESGYYFYTWGDNSIWLHLKTAMMGGGEWGNVNFSANVNTWYYTTMTYNGSILKLYQNGIEVDNQSISGNIDWGPNPYAQYFGCFLDDNDFITFDGALDEVRISNIARNISWISTSYYNQNDPTSFFTIENEEHAAPLVSNPNPDNGNNVVPNTPAYFEITVFDANPERMNITWRTNQSGNWETFNITNGGGSGVDDGTYNVTNTSWATTYDQIYYWSVNVSDGTHWTNETYSFSMHQFTPTINSFILQNQTGSKLDNQTGSLTCLEKYTFLINITDKNGWGDIDCINLTCWFDHGDDNNRYNETLGENLNMFLQYENTTGMGIFRMRWPDDEVIFSSSNCSETIINETTRIINISFTPNKQMRYAVSNNTWNIASDIFNDPYSWNVNCSVNDTQNNQVTIKSEYGVGWYAKIEATELVEITGAPGMIVNSTIMTITYSCNSAYHLYVYMEKNLTQVNGADIIAITNNLSLLENADPNDELTINTNFTGVGENHYITLFNTSAPVTDTQQNVDVQFELTIPFGTWGTYSSNVSKKINRME